METCIVRLIDNKINYISLDAAIILVLFTSHVAQAVIIIRPLKFTQHFSYRSYIYFFHNNIKTFLNKSYNKITFRKASSNDYIL